VTRSPHLRRRRRRRRDTEPASHTFAKALVVLAVLLAGGWLALQSYDGVPGRAYRTLVVAVPRAGNLIPHDPVRIAGVRVGQVDRTALGEDGDVRVRLQLEPGTELPADTQVRIRANGLLGARYVQLVPGRSSRTLADGATIRGDEAALTYGVPEALDTLDRPSRAGLGTTVRELGRGLLGEGPRTNGTLREISGLVVPTEALYREVLRPPGAAGRLVPAVDAALGPLERNRRQLAALMAPLARAVAPLVDERDAARRTLDLLPGTLAATDDGLTRGRPLLAAARELLSAADRTLETAPAGLRAATDLLRTSRRPLRRTALLLDEAGRAVPAALETVRRARPLLAPAREALDELRPVVRTTGEYGCDIVNFGSVFRSVTGFGGTGTGPNGPLMQFRLQAIAPMPSEVLGVPDTTGLVRRHSYPPPCTFRPSTYPAITRPSTRGGTR